MHMNIQRRHNVDTTATQEIAQTVTTFPHKPIKGKQI